MEILLGWSGLTLGLLAVALGLTGCSSEKKPEPLVSFRCEDGTKYDVRADEPVGLIFTLYECKEGKSKEVGEEKTKILNGRLEVRFDFVDGRLLLYLTEYVKSKSGLGLVSITCSYPLTTAVPKQWRLGRSSQILDLDMFELNEKEILAVWAEHVDGEPKGRRLPDDLEGIAEQTKEDPSGVVYVLIVQVVSD